MPLLKRKQWQPYVCPAAPGTRVIPLRASGEVFTSYDLFLKHFLLYRERQWQCELTGKTGLTFEEALTSERALAQQNHELFTVAQLDTICSVVHHNASPLDSLCKLLRSYFAHAFLPGDLVLATVDGKKLQCTVEECTDGQILPPSPVPLETLAYRCSVPGQADHITVTAPNLKSVGNPLTLTQIKAKIREVASRDPVTNRIWVCAPQYVEQFGLAEELPEDIANATPSKRRKSENGLRDGLPTPIAAARKNAVKYPIPDENIDRTVRGKPSDDPGEGEMPHPASDFPIADADMTGAVYVYDVINSCSPCLLLSPFSLQSFLEALANTDGKPDPILDHTVFALMCTLVPKSHVKHDSDKSRQAMQEWQQRRKRPRKVVLLSDSESDSSSSEDESGDEGDEGSKSEEKSGSGEDEIENEADADGDADGEESRGGSDKAAKKPRVKYPELTLLGWQAYLTLFLEHSPLSPLLGPAPVPAWVEDVMKALRQDAFPVLSSATKVAVLSWLVDCFLQTSTARHQFAYLSAERQDLSSKRWYMEKEERDRLKANSKKGQKGQKVDLGEDFKAKMDVMQLKGGLQYRLRLTSLGQDRFFNTYLYFLDNPRHLLVCDADGATHWRYYHTPQELDQLIAWLDSRGVRERALKQVLKAHRPMIAAGFKQSLVESNPVEVRRSRRVATQAEEQANLYENKLR